MVVGAVIVAAIGYFLSVSLIGLLGGCGATQVDRLMTAENVGDPVMADRLIESPVDYVPPVVTTTTVLAGPAPTVPASPPTTLPAVQPSFTALVTDLDDIGYIIPLGEVSPPSHISPSDHMYLTFKDPSRKVAVYVPGDATIASIRGSSWITSDGKPLEYMITFKVSETFSYYFGHLRDLEPWLMEKVADLKPDEWRELNIPVKAGIKLAKAGAVEGLAAFDWGVIDRTVEPVGFALPENYNMQTLYAQSPLRYCSENVLGQYLDKVADQNNSNKYGRIGWDIPGKLIGVWFAQDLQLLGDHHLAYKCSYPEKQISFVRYSRDPSRMIIGIGTDFELNGRFRAASSPRFEDVDKASGLVIYDLHDFFAEPSPASKVGRVLVQLTADDRIKVEVSSDPAVTAFSERAKIYTR